jgi:Ca-activated chloride channel family protein
MHRSIYILGLLAFAGLAWAHAAGFQAGVPASPDAAQFTLSMPADEVNLSFHAADGHGLPVNDLKLDELTLLDNGKPPKSVLAFYSLENHPIHAGILMDTSVSMQKYLPAAKLIAIQYTERLFRAHADQAMVMAFGYSRLTLEHWSGDANAIATGIRNVIAGRQNPPPGTALFDAIYSACFYDFGKAEHQASGNFILVFTDGEDNASQTSLQEVETVCQHSNTSVYAFHPEPVPGDISSGPPNLAELARQTGGRVFHLDESAPGIDSDLRTIEADLRNQYRIVYKPSEWKHDGSFHRIELRVPDRVGTVVVRPGYYAPVR